MSNVRAFPSNHATICAYALAQQADSLDETVSDQAIRQTALHFGISEDQVFNIIACETLGRLGTGLTTQPQLVVL